MGMGTDQGKIGNINALGIMAGHRGARCRRYRHDDLPPALHARPRSAASRARITAILLDPIRATRRSTAGMSGVGAPFENVGQWKRAVVLPQGRREHARCGHARVPGGARRAWASSMPRPWARSTSRARIRRAAQLGLHQRRGTKLEIGRCRYGLMCDEDGMVFDDGVTTRLGDASLPHDHHHRRCRPGPGLARELAADRMARSRRSIAPR